MKKHPTFPDNLRCTEHILASCRSSFLKTGTVFMVLLLDIQEQLLSVYETNF